MNTDKKTFVNPVSWSYFGTYTVELIDGADTSFVSKNPKNIINKNTVTIPDGSLGQSIGGISMKDSMNHNFHWGYHHIICIRDENGDLLWVNDNYRDR